MGTVPKPSTQLAVRGNPINRRRALNEREVKMTIKVFSKKRINTKTGVQFVSYFTYINDKPVSVRFCKTCQAPMFCPIKINIGEQNNNFFVKTVNGFKTIYVRIYEEVIEDEEI